MDVHPPKGSLMLQVARCVGSGEGLEGLLTQTCIPFFRGRLFLSLKVSGTSSHSTSRNPSAQEKMEEPHLPSARKVTPSCLGRRRRPSRDVVSESKNAPGVDVSRHGRRRDVLPFKPPLRTQFSDDSCGSSSFSLPSNDSCGLATGPIRCG